MIVDRLLIVPAAGLGTRLGGRMPKLLVKLNGRPMIEHLLELYAPMVDRVAVITSPPAARQVREVLGPDVDIFVQTEPTGMLDAILLAAPAVAGHRPGRVLVSWCDQLAIHPATLGRLQAATTAPAETPLALLTCVRPDPYIHLVRDGAGRICRVLQRREGDIMPVTGESDAGVFDLSLDAYLHGLTEYAQLLEVGAGTGERNFLPFIPWLAARQDVVTVPCETLEETIGVNTPEELAFVERYLRERSAPDA